MEKQFGKTSEKKKIIEEPFVGKRTEGEEKLANDCQIPPHPTNRIREKEPWERVEPSR